MSRVNFALMLLILISTLHRSPAAQSTAKGEKQRTATVSGQVTLNGSLWAVSRSDYFRIECLCPEIRGRLIRPSRMSRGGIASLGLLQGVIMSASFPTNY